MVEDLMLEEEALVYHQHAKILDKWVSEDQDCSLMTCCSSSLEDTDNNCYMLCQDSRELEQVVDTVAQA